LGPPARSSFMARRRDTGVADAATRLVEKLMKPARPRRGRLAVRF
jgi:hypothetical protein